MAGIGSFIFCRSSFAVSLQSNQCPTQFVGNVVAVSSPQAPFHSLSKVKVRFEVSIQIQGELSEYREIEVLKYGAYKFVAGEKYDVSLRNGFICSLTKRRS